MPSNSICAANVRHFRTAVCLFGMLSIVAVGCDSGPAETVEEPPKVRTPEERFDTIVQTLKHGLETTTSDSPAAGADAGAVNGDAVATARIRVEHELKPPASEGEPYRASVTFISSSTVTVVLPPPTKNDKPPGTKTSSSTPAELKLEGLDIEQLKVPTTASLAERMGSSPIHELEKEDDERTFNLEVKDGRWVLLNEPDPDTEPYYDLVLKRALRNQ